MLAFRLAVSLSENNEKYRPLTALEDASSPIQGLGQNFDLLPGALQVVLVDGFVDSGDDDRSIASILAWRVDGMAEPWPIGQTFRYQQRPLGIAQGFVQF